MMTFCWTLEKTFDENGRPNGSDETLDYVADLCKQLSREQYLYAEIRWRDPLGV